MTFEINNLSFFSLADIFLGTLFDKRPFGWTEQRNSLPPFAAVLY
ncbi:hypothetical protein [Novosphingopyxis sp. YJ-S2-01]|nr:hypothetical protein [Novosphingopyxis sp. YJ-S2-01]